jgi:hypothetical protein
MTPLVSSSDLSGWFEAGGSVVTALIALYLLGREQADRRRVAHDKRAAQASQVKLTAAHAQHLKSSPDGTLFHLQTEVKNESDDVISDVFIRLALALSPRKRSAGCP